MGYKVLGFAVWQGGRFFLRRRFPGAPRKMALIGLGGTLVAAGVAVTVVAVGRRRAAGSA